MEVALVIVGALIIIGALRGIFQSNDNSEERVDAEMDR